MAKELTQRERLALTFLDNLMWSDAISVGRAIYKGMDGKGGSSLPSIGANVLGRLRKRGLVGVLPDLGLWRITSAGLAALKEHTS